MFEVNRQVEFPAGMNKVLCYCFCSSLSNSQSGTESVFGQSTGPLIKRIQCGLPGIFVTCLRVQLSAGDLAM